MLDKYNPKQIENKWQSFWKKNDYFKSHNSELKAFTIIMPPPNVTGKLHLGHAWDLYYPDLLIRYKQLHNYDAIWYPGTDHAGIATQAIVEKRLYEEQNLTRLDLGREKFLQKMWSWKDEYQKDILAQWDKLGIAADFDKLKFTLDKDVNDLVLNSFVELYNKGLIFRAKKLINWDPILKTAISNIEINHEQINGKLYDVIYKLKDSKETLIVSTTRPETMFGDKALVVHPKDERYGKLIGKIAINPVNGEELPILADSYVDIEFGTAVMKVTPAHDFNDYELAKKHKLAFVNIFNEDATLNKECGKYANLSREEARIKVVTDLKANQQIAKIVDYPHIVSLSERSGALIEPRLSIQWFIDAKKLSTNALKNQDTKTPINFYPKRFENDFTNWSEKMEDWCISRQLWWGHQIPAWYFEDQIKVQIESPGENWIQDEDVLDTWYSSGLWPLVFKDEAVIKRQDNPNYLSSTLFTGYDIILFWVSRMIFLAIEIDGRPPFHNEINHGLIRDNQGRKMSKSLGNGVDPMEEIDKWGSDSLRTYLLGNSTPGQDLKYNVKKINSAWDVNNKLFNTAKLIDHLIEVNKLVDFSKKDLKDLIPTKIDTYILEKFNNLVKNIEENVEIYNLTIIYENINKFIFNQFANNYLEFVKKDPTKKQLENTLNIFANILIVLHPFIPFLTEELYDNLKKHLVLKKSILLESYPKEVSTEVDGDAQVLLTLYKAIRICQSMPKIKNNSIITLTTSIKINKQFIDLFIKNTNTIININQDVQEATGVVITPGVGIVYYSLEDSALKSKKQLIKETLKHLEAELSRAKSFLENKKFIAHADKKLIEKEKAKVLFYQKSIEIIINENKN